MTNESKTLFIPLYGKAIMSKEILEAEIDFAMDVPELLEKENVS